MEFTVEPVRRIFKRAGAKRVSDKAALELAQLLEAKTRQVAEEAKKLALHANRRTVLKRDIKLAGKILREK